MNTSHSFRIFYSSVLVAVMSAAMLVIPLAVNTSQQAQATHATCSLWAGVPFAVDVGPQYTYVRSRGEIDCNGAGTRTLRIEIWRGKDGDFSQFRYQIFQSTSDINTFTEKLITGTGCWTYYTKVEGTLMYNGTIHWANYLGKKSTKRTICA